MPFRPGSDLAGQFGHGVEEVGDEAEIGDLEDRGVLVLVDRDDRLRILHAGEVLDRTRDTDREVDVRRDDLAGLADLIVVTSEASRVVHECERTGSARWWPQQ